jgi:hypothetical protein
MAKKTTTTRVVKGGTPRGAPVRTTQVTRKGSGAVKKATVTTKPRRY